MSETAFPNGCQHCGVGEREHTLEWGVPVGYHRYAAPDDVTRLSRMRKRGDALLLSMAKTAFVCSMRDNVSSMTPGEAENVFDLVIAELKRTAAQEAWEVGVATALNHAKRGPDGITLNLVTFEGEPWANPYRKETQ